MKIRDSIRKLPFVYPTYLRLWGKMNKLDLSGIQTYIMFIGYPRSGHTLLGALLDAHPQAAISIELDALKWVMQKQSKQNLYLAILRKSHVFRSKFKCIWNSFSYLVNGMHQGNLNGLTHIGDKKGAKSTVRLGKHPHLLKDLKDLVEIPIKIIHVVRNPFDTITTIVLRMQQKGFPMSEELVWDRIDYFFNNAKVNAQLIKDHKDSIRTIYHEDLIKNPYSEMCKMLEFLGLPVIESYLKACQEKVNKNAHKSRHKLEWTAAMKARVLEESSNIPFLKFYSWDD